MISIRSNAIRLVVCLLTLVSLSRAFVLFPSVTRHGSLSIRKAQEEVGENQLLTDLKMRFRIFQESSASGNDVKQTLANVLAGDYDEDKIRSELNAVVASESCVIFTWENSPSCVSTVKALEITGAKYKNVRLDDPWDKGNPIRAEIGKMVGKSSVPCIFIGGKYVGGYDSGISEEAPGILSLAFQGTLRTKLEAAGAL